MPSENYFAVVERRITVEVRRAIGPPPSPLHVPKEILEKALEGGGLKQIDQLLRQAPGTAFQRKLLESLQIYARQRLTRDPIEKLIFALVALETLLLKDQHEPIRYKLGERLALALGGSLEQREATIKIVFEAYDLRSRYLHHGHELHDTETIEGMLGKAYLFFWLLLEQQDRFGSHEDLVQALDRARLTGPSVLRRIVARPS